MNQELLLRRRRTRIRPRNEASASSNNDGTNNDDRPMTHLPGKCEWLAWWTAAVHVAALLMIVVGFILRNDFHTGEECEMTYSMRHFVELTNGPSHSVYRLYKFTDRRDPRQQHLHEIDRVHGDKDWCTSPVVNATIVLYVPGHWGSYSQARSLGAHGLQWTRQHVPYPLLQQQQQHFLRNGTWNGQSATLQNFVYDVFAIDFREQGGALHANLLHAQSAYVASVITTLMEKCHTPNIALVGHSMGGLVARRSLAIIHPPTHISNLITFIITLATPHERLPYGFDESIHKFYNLLDKSHDQETETTLVSISGGLRDEMIPPSVCHAPNNNTNNKTFSILANDVMVDGVFGMDHRAIVWCHELLEVVRIVLHAMIVRGNVSKREEKHLQNLFHKSDDYDQAVATQYETFRRRYGFIKSTAMESAMLYHFELLLGIYAVTGCVYHAFPSVSVAVVPCLVSVLGVWCTTTNTKAAVVVVLALVANAIYWLVRWLPTKTMSAARSIKSLPPKSRHVWQLVLAFVEIQLGVALFGYCTQNGSIVFLSLTPAVFMSLILLLPIVSLERRTTQNETFLSLFLPVLPLLVAGKCYMIAWSLWMEFDESLMSDDVLNFVWRIVVPSYLRIIIVVGERPPRCAPFLHAIALFHFAPRVLGVGGGYVVGYLVACLAWIDVIAFLGASYLFTIIRR